MSKAAAIRRAQPVTRASRPIVDTENETIGGQGVASMAPTGAPRIDHDDEVTHVEPSRYVPKAKADRMAFDNEMVTVMVQESGDTKYPDPCISVWVNGRHQLFVRNYPITCKRMFVEGLARSRPETFDNQEYVNADGIKGYRWPKRTALKYPFQLLQDSNPAGVEWLKGILATPR